MADEPRDPGGSTPAATLPADPATSAPADRESSSRGDPYADHDAIRRIAREIIDQNKIQRRRLEQTFFRNALMFLGHQWIWFNEQRNTWLRKRLEHWVPMPVTNRIAAGVNALIAVVLRIQPSATYRPMTNDPEDIAAADVADAVAQVCLDESEVLDDAPLLAYWVVVTGNAFAMNYYDTDERHGTVRVALLACQDCGTVHTPAQAVQADESVRCFNCGSGALAKTGEERRYPRGRLQTQILSPFEVFPGDPEVPRIEKQTRMVVRRRISVRAGKARYPKRAEEISPDETADQGIAFQESLTYLAIHGEGLQNTFIPYGSEREDRLTEITLFLLPSAVKGEVFPDGLHAVLYGDTVMHAGPLASRWDDGEDGKPGTPFIPLVHFRYELIGHSFFARTPVDDAIQLQTSRNLTESMLILIHRRMGNPVWLNPDGSGVKNFTGMPGQVLNYNPNNPARVKPERIPGVSAPPSIALYLQSLDAAIEDLLGIYDILKGARPPGISAGYALQILLERAQSRHGPLFRAWERAHEQLIRQQLALFKLFATEDRVYQIKGRNAKWEIKHFNQSTLAGRINVKVEAGSAAPRSQVAQRVDADLVIQRGLVNPQLPDVRRKILERFGSADLDVPFDTSLKSIFREQERFLERDWQDPEILARLERLTAEAQKASAGARIIRATIQQLESLGQGMPPAGGNGEPGQSPADQAEALERIARQSIDQMFDLAGLTFRETDDHALHADYHRTFCREETFEGLPRPVQKLMLMHVRQHETEILRKALESQQAMAPAVAAAKAGVPLGGPKPGRRTANQFRPVGASSKQVFAQGGGRMPEETAMQRGGSAQAGA